MSLVGCTIFCMKNAFCNGPSILHIMPAPDSQRHSAFPYPPKYCGWFRPGGPEYNPPECWKDPHGNTQGIRGTIPTSQGFRIRRRTGCIRNIRGACRGRECLQSAPYILQRPAHYMLRQLLLHWILHSRIHRPCAEKRKHDHSAFAVQAMGRRVSCTAVYAVYDTITGRKFHGYFRT